MQQLQQLFPGSSPYKHPRVDTAVILPGKGPLPLNLDAAGDCLSTAEDSSLPAQCISDVTWAQKVILTAATLHTC